MVYLDISKATAALLFPRHEWTPTGDLELELVSTVNNGSVKPVVTACQVRGDYLAISLEVPAKMHAGEYEYKLRYSAGREKVTSVGLLQAVLDEKDTPVQYKEEIEYKQYGK